MKRLHFFIPFLTSVFLIYSCKKNNENPLPSSAVAVSTYAGSAQGFLEGQRLEAQFNLPTGIAFAKNGYMFITCKGDGRVRAISPEGVTGTIADNFDQCDGIAIDNDNNIYVSDMGHDVIRKLSMDGTVTILGSGAGYVDGPLAAAKFGKPAGLAVDAAGNIIVADLGNAVIRKISPDGIVSTLAGSHVMGFKDGSANQAKFAYPAGVAVDAANNVYVADELNDLIRKITPDGIVSTFAGTFQARSYRDGPADTACFYDPYGITIDKSGNLYIAEWANHTIRKVTQDGVVTGYAGFQDARWISDQYGDRYVNTGDIGGYLDGRGDKAMFHQPAGIAFDANGDLYVADQANCKIRKIVKNVQ